MTKKDYLRTKADPEERVMTWKSLGSNIINDSTKIYIANQIYYVNIPLSELNGTLLYCNMDYTGNVNWLQGTLFDVSYGEISFGYNTASPYFSVLLTPNEFQEVDTTSQSFINTYKGFVPYKDFQLEDEVTISDADYKRIISVLGAPFIREFELEYTRDDICELAIKPALEEYFHWIPAVRPTTVEAGQGSTGGYWHEDPKTGDWVKESDSLMSDGSIIVDMPSWAYNVVGLSLQQLGGAMNGNMLSPLFYGMEQALYSGMNYTGLSGSYTGTKAPKTQTNTVANVIASRAQAQALINYGRRVHYEGPYERVDEKTGAYTGEKYIKVWSNTSGMLNIWWARRTLNFDDVQYQHRTRVFEYAQANVRELFANLRTQSKSDIPGLVDYKDWWDKAEKTKERITDEYKKIVKASGVMRGSL